MALTSRSRIVGLLAAAALAWGAGAAPATAAPAEAPRASAATAVEGRLGASADREVLPPGATTTIEVYSSTDGGYQWSPVEGAHFRASGHKVLRVTRDGTVQALSPGVATVEVRHGRLRTTVTFDVRERALTTEYPRSSPGCECTVGVFSGFGFTPGAEITFATDGTPGVWVGGPAVADASGAFAGEIEPMWGDVISGVVWVVDRPSSTAGPTCERGTPFTITATDSSGLSAVFRSTC